MGKRTHPPAWVSFAISTKQTDRLICSKAHYVVYPHRFCRVAVSLSFLEIWEPEPSEESPALTETATLQHFNFCAGQVPHTASPNTPGRTGNHRAFVFTQHLFFASSWPPRALKTPATSHLQANGSKGGGLPLSRESASGRRDFHGTKLRSR